MNICFFKGRIITEIEFDFLYNSRSVSIAIFKVELSNKSTITIKAYDDLADFCYCNLKTNQIIFIQGEIISNEVILLEKIELL